MVRSRTVIRFVNIAHAYDHLAILIFPTAVVGMSGAFGLSYGELIGLSLGGFIAFGAGSLPAGWLGDRWSRRNMMAVFFVGLGLALVATGLSDSPTMLAVGLTVVGLFASIYHPVGTAMLVAVAERVGREIGWNGVWGNLGVAGAALITGALTDWLGWRWAFFIPGLGAILVGLLFLHLVPDRALPMPASRVAAPPLARRTLVRAFAVLLAVTIASGVVFNATTVSLPKLLFDRVDLAHGSALGAGVLASLIFVMGATAQLIVGHAIDRRPLRSVFIALSVLQAPFLAAATIATDWAMLLAALVMMFAVFGQVTINDAMVAQYTTESWRSRAYSVRYFASFGGSAAAIPLIALTYESTGEFALLYAILATLGGVVFFGALVLPRRELRSSSIASPAR